MFRRTVPGQQAGTSPYIQRFLYQVQSVVCSFPTSYRSSLAVWPVERAGANRIFAHHTCSELALPLLCSFAIAHLLLLVCKAKYWLASAPTCKRLARPTSAPPCKYYVSGILQDLRPRHLNLDSSLLLPRREEGFSRQVWRADTEHKP